MRRIALSAFKIGLAAGLLMTVWGTSVFAGPASLGLKLEKMSTVVHSEDRVDLMLHLNGQPEFSAFRLKNPERVIIDLCQD